MIFKKASEKINTFIPKEALLLSGLIFLSYVLGLVRDRIFARTFGLSSALDAYNAAFILPELFIDVLISGALGAAFIPLFVEIYKKDKARSEEFANTTITSAVLVMIIGAAVLILFAPKTVSLIVPGFNAENQLLYSNLLRIMALSPIIFALSISLGEILVAKRQFLFYGLAPILYNFGIILGTIILSPKIGIFGAAIGSILGALLYLAIRLLGIFRSDFSLKPAFNIKMPEFRKLLVLMLPKMFGHPIEPLTFLFFTAAASRIGSGDISAISFGRNFQSVPVALIGIAFSIVVFPVLSEYASGGNRTDFIKTFKKTFTAILLLSLPATFGMYLFGPLVIERFFGGGEFTQEAIQRTSLILGFFSISIPLESLSHLLSRAFFATKNTFIPVCAAFAGLLTIVITTNYLSPTLGIIALPIAFASGTATKILLLGAILPLRVRFIRKNSLLDVASI